MIFGENNLRLARAATVGETVADIYEPLACSCQAPHVLALAIRAVTAAFFPKRKGHAHTIRRNPFEPIAVNWQLQIMPPQNAFNVGVEPVAQNMDRPASLFAKRRELNKAVRQRLLCTKLFKLRARYARVRSRDFQHFARRNLIALPTLDRVLTRRPIAERSEESIAHVVPRDGVVKVEEEEYRNAFQNKFARRGLVRNDGRGVFMKKLLADVRRIFFGGEILATLDGASNIFRLRPGRQKRFARHDKFFIVEIGIIDENIFFIKPANNNGVRMVCFIPIRQRGCSHRNDTWLLFALQSS